VQRSALQRFLIAAAMAIPPLTVAPGNISQTRAAGNPPVPVKPLINPQQLSQLDLQRLAQHATQRVVVIFNNQPAPVPAGSNAPQAQALAATQGPILAQLSQVGAPVRHVFHLFNAVAATVSPAEAALLATLPQVRAVVPDSPIHPPQSTRDSSDGAGAPPTAFAPNSAACTAQPTTEPEALQVTNDYFDNQSIPQAQQLATGKGVVVATMAEGVDPNNPDLIRPDGTHVITDYEDFTGDGLNAPTGSGGEAFGDVSSIAAQGRQTYDLNPIVNVAHRRPTCMPIRILGMAPGASIMYLKIFSGTNQTFLSTAAEAVEYAMDHGANVINESLGFNFYPDDENSPLVLANDNAVQAGVTVVVASGDAGIAGTQGVPGSDPNVINAGASTTFRIYSQTVDAGIQLGSGGYVSNNISAITSSGFSLSDPAMVQGHAGPRTNDVVAPGDLNWAICTPDLVLFPSCTDFNNPPNPSPVEEFGGTSESSPLTAGEAALIIQAYQSTHGGATPSPALVKQIIMSSATDLGMPSAEQGAGLINSLKAVQMALSQPSTSKKPVGQSASLLVSPSALAATAAPNTPEQFSIQVTNTGSGLQVVRPLVEAVDHVISTQSFRPTLDVNSDPTFIDAFGFSRAYVSQPFLVLAGDRLDASVAWNVVAHPGTLARLSLFDPSGNLAAYSLPQGAGQGFGQVDVHAPTPGLWRAVIWTRASSLGYSGPVQLTVTAFDARTAGTVSPPVGAVLPGQTSTFTVNVSTPGQAGDQSEEVVFQGPAPAARPFGPAPLAGAVPINLRSVVPLGPAGGTFSGVLTGGNGRGPSNNAPGQQLFYEFDVPSGLQNLALNVALSDTNNNLEGVLVNPAGLPVDVQSTATTIDPNTGEPIGFTNTLQFFRRNPEPGRWRFVLLINVMVSGLETAQPVTGAIAFNTVQAQASGLPSAPSTVLKQGVPVNATIQIANTGNTTKDFFLDPRTSAQDTILVGGATTTLPVPFGVPLLYFVPPESNEFDVLDEATSPSVPVLQDVYSVTGTPPSGATVTPEFSGQVLLDPTSGLLFSQASLAAPEVPFGFYTNTPTVTGPSRTSAPTSTLEDLGVAVTQHFDDAVTSDTGDLWPLALGASGAYTPLTLAPGQSGAIHVTITASAPVGTVVTGFLYVDTAALSNGFLVTGSGDEVVAIPYSYTVGG
jgi:hypothetical protein